MLRYLRSAFAFVFIMVCCLYRCQPNQMGLKLPPDYIALRAGESAFTQAGPLVIADTLSAFICPFNASCSTPDRIVVSLRLMRGKESRLVRLSSSISEHDYKRFSNARSDSTGAQFGKQSYKVVLRGPYTKNPYKPDRQAVIQVSRL